MTVSIPLPSAPSGVTLASPDMPQDVALSATYANGSVSVTLPALLAYDVIAVAY